MDKFSWRIHTVESVLSFGGIPGHPSFFLWRLSYTDVLMKLFNAFVIGVVVAAAALALIYRREVREMVLPIVRNLW